MRCTQVESQLRFADFNLTILLFASAKISPIARQLGDLRRYPTILYAETITMNSHRFDIACTVFAMAVVATISYGVNSEAAIADPSLAPFEFDREGAISPQDAATALFRGCAEESPKHFVQHLLLGVCDGPIATLQKFAECLHRTKFSHGEDSYTVYDLPNAIDSKNSIRAIGSQHFDPQDKHVAALRFQMKSTYYAEKFMCLDVAAKGYDGLEYRTRIVVAQVKDRWYSIPRCRSAKSFYEIADAMRLTTPELEPTK